MKIIHILCHSPGPGAYRNKNRDTKPKLGSSDYKRDREHYFRISNPPYWAGYFSNDFHVKLANSTQKETTDFLQECWRPYNKIDKIKSKYIDGVKHKLFPSDYIRSKYLGRGEKSPSLIENLENEIRGSEVLIHLHGYHTDFIENIIFKSKLSEVPTVVTQRGESYRNANIFQKPWIIKKYIVENLFSSKIDYYVLQSKFEYEHYSNKVGSENCWLVMDGIDYNLFKPIEKYKARKKIGLKSNDKVLLYVGIFESNRGIENILWAYDNLKQKDSSYKLILVGGEPDRPLFRIASRTDSIVLPRIPVSDLINYYSAADIHIFPTSDKDFIKGTALGNANIEAMACNTAIYSSQLSHFLGTKYEKEKVGVDCGLITNKEVMLTDIQDMFSELDKYNSTRKISRKYYDRSKNVKKMVRVYRDLINHYYKK